jgi:hypothetical protein
MPPVFGPGRRRARACGPGWWPAAARAAVDHDDETRFLADQEFLDHHAVAGFAEGIAGEHVAHCRDRLSSVVGDDHALAGRQPVGLDHDRRAALADIGQRRLDLGEVRYSAVGMAWRARKSLVKALEPSSCAAPRSGRSSAAPRRGKVDHAAHQRRLGADDGEPDGIVARELRAAARNPSRRSRRSRRRARVRCRRCRAPRTRYPPGDSVPPSRPARARVRRCR